MSAKNTGDGKRKIAQLNRDINKLKKELEKVSRQEKKSREIWTKAYNRFIKAANDLTEIKRRNTKKEASLIKIIKDWPNETIRLTETRDDSRKQIKSLEQSLIELGTEKAILTEYEINKTKETDEIVTQIFELNKAVVSASEARLDCLKRHVYSRLTPEITHISFNSSDGLRRVTTSVNNLTIVRKDLASQAKSEIQSFFDRFQKASKVDHNVKPLFELTKQLLIEKTDFKVGPNLNRFLAMELDTDIFPELSRAQTLLRQSITHEKTSSYIRILQRASSADRWEAVKQS